MAQHIFDKHLKAFHIFNDLGEKQTLDMLLEGENKKVWSQALSNELGRLAQGNDAGVRSTDAIDFIFHYEVPHGSKVTYANFRMDHRPLKEEEWRIRLVVGGDKLDYDNDSGSPAASLLETKLLLNSVISDIAKNARFFTCDLKDHFLASPMDKPEYMRIPTKCIPQDIMDRYNLQEKVHKGYVYVKIKRGMYGLKQAAILAYNHLKNILKEYGYCPVTNTIGIWKHDTRPTTFCLCVDDFGVKYHSQEDAEHLLSALRDH